MILALRFKDQSALGTVTHAQRIFSAQVAFHGLPRLSMKNHHAVRARGETFFASRAPFLIDHPDRQRFVRGKGIGGTSLRARRGIALPANVRAVQPGYGFVQTDLPPAHHPDQAVSRIERAFTVNHRAGKLANPASDAPLLDHPQALHGRSSTHPFSTLAQRFGDRFQICPLAPKMSSA